MYIGILIRLILGYVRIEVEGYYIERFINICTTRKILIWNLKREKNVKLYLNIGISDFKKLSEIARKTKCRVKIKKKKGMPFLLNRYRKRKIFGVLLILVCILIYFSSGYIWNIEISVKDNVEIEGIREELQNLGLAKGVKKAKVDTDSIINKLKLERNDISWIGIDIEGTNAIVNIVRSDTPPDIVDKKDYSNIVAKKSGIITKITARNGTAKVKVGDTVQEGTILIEGLMEGKYTEPRKVHSLGEVLARVWYTESEKVYFKQTLKKNTGNEEVKYELNFTNYKLNLYQKISKFNLYETNKETKNLKFGKNFYLPIGFTKIINKEQIEEQVEYTIEEAKNIGIDTLSKKIEDEIEDKENICDKIIKTEENSDYVEVFVTYEVVESIGEDQRI